MTKVFTEEENKQWQRTLPAKISSACVALRSGNKVLMVKAHYKDHWTFPSGIVDANESPKAAAMRETREEVGVELDDIEVEFLATIYTQGKVGYLDRFNFVFLVEQFDESRSLILQPEEIEKTEWVELDEIARYSGNKGSYIHVQRLLTNNLNNEKYIEVL
jgi:8-oxo-dGTP pyrophosphatase MutT (NUDIX family)